MIEVETKIRATIVEAIGAVTVEVLHAVDDLGRSPRRPVRRINLSDAADHLTPTPHLEDGLIRAPGQTEAEVHANERSLVFGENMPQIIPALAPTPISGGS